MESKAIIRDERSVCVLSLFVLHIRYMEEVLRKLRFFDLGDISVSRNFNSKSERKNRKISLTGFEKIF
jgi:hypothetical protein